MKTYKPTIGLEIHAQLKTNRKMFCDCENNPEAETANVNICPICMGHPGTLPVINKEAVNMVIKTGLALNCNINAHTWFERKNYFYPDLPKNYQISQKEKPLCENGELKINGNQVQIHEIHLEEDTGRSIHSPKDNTSSVDFNRAGIPLMELVTEPDIHSAEEARKFCEQLRLIFRYLQISDANMEKGQMRCEANISLGSTDKLGTKVEIKNLNSFKAVERAIGYEIERQTEVLESGGKITHETRGWNEKKQKTFSQRTKEVAKDYRYFPEPDLPPLNISEKDIKKIKSQIPELPAQRKFRFRKEYKISDQHIETFANYKYLGDYFEKTISELKNWDKSAHIKKQPPTHIQKLIKLTANYLTTELKKYLSTLEEVGNIKISPENFAEFIILVNKGQISSSGAQKVLAEMLKTGADPSTIVEEKDLKQVSNESELEKIVEKVIKNNPQPVKDYHQGKNEALQFLIGQVMRFSQGKANPQVASKVLKKLIPKHINIVSKKNKK